MKKSLALLAAIITIVSVLFVSSGCDSRNMTVISECGNFSLDVSVDTFRVKRGETVVVTAALTNLTRQILAVRFVDIMLESGESGLNNPNNVLPQLILAINLIPYGSVLAGGPASYLWGIAVLLPNRPVIRTKQIKMCEVGQYVIIVKSEFITGCDSLIKLKHNSNIVRVS